MTRRALFIGAAVLACQGNPGEGTGSARRAWVVLHAAADSVDLNTVRAEPAGVVESSVRHGSRVVLALRPTTERGELYIEAERACPLSVPIAELAAGAVVERKLVPMLDFGGPYPGVGFDTPLTIEVTPGCPEAEAGRIEWRQARGPRAELRSEARGFRLHLQTPKARDVLGGELPWGIVPIAPRTRGSSLFEADWRGPRPQGGARNLRFELEVNAAYRSHGLPNVALGTRLLLAQEGWRVVEAPAGAMAKPQVAGGFTTLEPDVHGRWLLEDAAHRKLSLHAARYDHTPLDCGRAECHASIAAAALKSPMTTILERELERGQPGYPACAIGCHATGEPGARDGGFSHVAAEIGRQPADLVSADGGWHDLPRGLRRLGGVGCLACHGPGAIPEPEARSGVLRSDVCAYCHDAPPRYGHVAAWRSSAMARSDRDLHARTEPRCTRCHTTSGFLADQGARVEPDSKARSAAAIEPIGISCSACHAVHASEPASGTLSALLRPVRMPTLLSDQPVDPKSRVCTPCHTPSVDEGLPSASAAALLAGRGGVDPSSGAALEGPAPHAKVAGGCLACHRAGPSGIERGAAHAFAASRDTCLPCHAPPAEPNRKALHDRAKMLWAKLLPRVPRGAQALSSQPSRPPHATARAVNARTALGRATRNVLLVIEDPAAAEHNLPYARKLLDASERWLESPKP